MKKNGELSWLRTKRRMARTTRPRPRGGREKTTTVHTAVAGRSKPTPQHGLSDERLFYEEKMEES